MFLPGGELHDTFCPSKFSRSHDRSTVEDHMLTLNHDREIKDYLERCHVALIQNADVRASLKAHGIEEDHIKSLTCGVYDRLVPDELTNSAPKIKNGDWLVFPYTCGGMVTCLAVVDPSNNLRNNVTILPDAESFGIFQEDCIGDDGPVYVCRSEISAALLGSKFSEFTDRPSNAVCFKSTKALDNVPEEKAVCLVSTPDEPLHFHQAAVYWIDWRDRRELLVVDLPRRMANFQGNDLRHILKESSPLAEWLVDNLARVNRKSGPAEVTKLVSSVGFKKKDKHALLDMMKEAGHDDPLFLSAIRNAKLAGSLMAYGDRKIRRNATIYTDVTGAPKALSNFVVFADTVTEDDKGNRILIGRVKTDDPNLPLIPVSFKTKDLLNPHGSKLTESVWGQSKAKGHNFVPWAGELYGGMTWFNVLTGFDDPEYQRSVISLGAQDDGILNFPRVRLDTVTRHMGEGGYLYGVDKEVSDMYGEIVKSSSYDADVLRSLLESPNPMIERLRMMLGHMLHQTVVPVVVSNRFHARHLVVPYAAEEDALYNAFSQLFCMISGNPRPLIVPSSAPDFNHFVKTNRQLVTLPGMYVVRTGSKNNLGEWLYSSSNSVILAVPAREVSNLSRETSTYFLYDVTEHIGYRDMLSHEILDTIRRAWPHLIYSSVAKVDKAADVSPDINPIMRGLEWMAEEVGANLVKSETVTCDYYTVPGRNRIDLFLSLLGKEAHNGNLVLAQSHHAFRSASGKYHGYYQGDQVLFRSNACLELLKDKPAEFQVSHLRDQCMERGWLDDPKRGSIIVDKNEWMRHFRPDKGAVLTKEDLRLVRVS